MAGTVVALGEKTPEATRNMDLRSMVNRTLFDHCPTTSWWSNGVLGGCLATHRPNFMLKLGLRQAKNPLEALKNVSLRSTIGCPILDHCPTTVWWDHGTISLCGYQRSPNFIVKLGLRWAQIHQKPRGTWIYDPL